MICALIYLAWVVSSATAVFSWGWFFFWLFFETIVGLSIYLLLVLGLVVYSKFLKFRYKLWFKDKK